MLGMDLLENSNCIRVSLHKKTQFCKTEIRVLSNKCVILHLLVDSTVAELWEVFIDGTEKLRAVFDGDKFNRVK